MIPVSELTPKEQTLFGLLRSGEPVATRDLLKQLGYDDDHESNRVAVRKMISNLRKKVEKYGLLITPYYPGSTHVHYRLVRRLVNDE